MSTLAQDYITKWRPIITPIAQKYGINPDFALAQIAQESWWGTKTPAGSHNYAGIQDFRKKSDGVMADDAGRQRKFRKFANEQDFAEHYLNMLYRLYPGTTKANTIDEFTSALQDGTRKYAESPKYKQYVGEVYNRHFANATGQPLIQERVVTSAQNPPTGQRRSGISQHTGSMVNTLPAVGGGFEIQGSSPDTADDRDPYETLWGIKVPKHDEVAQPRLVNARTSPYRGGNFKFNY